MVGNDTLSGYVMVVLVFVEGFSGGRLVVWASVRRVGGHADILY
ncbi:hypothetical protein [Acaryochloris marina]|nr:hypothetical protein [Acaryochloris marina]